MSKSEIRVLLFILVIAFLIRLGWAIAQPSSAAVIDRLPDQREYLSLAWNLIHHGSFGFFDSRFGEMVYAYRMPGYPLFLAACGEVARLVRIVQCAVDVSTVLAVFLIARKLTGRARIGLIAAGILAINPFYIYFSSLILTETLFTALIAWGIWFVVENKWIPSLLVLIASIYVRPSGLMFLPLVLFAGKKNWDHVGPYQLLDVLRKAAITTFAAILCLLPWAYRNHHILGEWIWTTTNGGVTLYDGFNSDANGASDQRFIAFTRGLRSINEVGRDRFFVSRAKSWIGHNWRAIPALSIRKICRGWSPIPLSQEFGRPVYRWISAGYSVPFDVLCAIGFFSPRLNRGAKLLLVMPALIVTLAQVLSVGSIRYRIPAEAPLAVLAALGISDSKNEISNDE